MNSNVKLAAALMVGLLLLSIAPAAALAPTSTDHQVFITSGTLHVPHQAPGTIAGILLGLSLLGVAGTVALTYMTPSLGPGAPTITLGGTVPPTAAQATNINVLVVEASTADGDTSIVLVHNWGLSAADLSAGLPIATIGLDTAGTAVPVLTGRVTGSAANTLTFTKASAAGSGGTIVFSLVKPHTSIR